MWPVEIKSRDGLTLPSYLTLPAGADANGDGHADQPVPLVLFVHGGPWARDSYGYNSVPPVARQPRLCGAVGQLPRLDRLRQEVHHRRQPAVGPEDARRPDRRVDWAVANGDDHPRQGRDHGRQLRRLCDARRPDLHAGQVRLRRRHRRAVEPVHAAPDDPALLGGGQASSSTSAWATRRRKRDGRCSRSVAAVLCRQDPAAAADRPGRQRPAGQQARSRTRSSRR